MEEALQLFCTVEKGGAPSCHVSHGGSALPTPPARGIGRASTRTAAPPPRRCGRKDRGGETALKGDKQALIINLLTAETETADRASAALMGQDFRAGAVLLRRPGCALGSNSPRVKEIRLLRATCVYTEAIQSHVLASKLGWNSTVQDCSAFDSLPMQPVEEQSREARHRHMSI